MRDDVSSAFGDVTLVRDAHTRDDEDAGVALSTGPHVLGEEGDFGGCAFGDGGVGAAEVDGGLRRGGGEGRGRSWGVDEGGGEDGDSLHVEKQSNERGIKHANPDRSGPKEGRRERKKERRARTFQHPAAWNGNPLSNLSFVFGLVGKSSSSGLGSQVSPIFWKRSPVWMSRPTQVS